jgi:hypothetical protein
MILKKYVIESVPGGSEAIVHHSDYPNDTSRLGTKDSFFEWGYEGVGPTILAHAMLADSIANRFCDGLMKDLVSQRSEINEHRPAVVFYEKEILLWLRDKLNGMKIE